MDKVRIELTEDGSATVYNASVNEHYHSVHGAVQESMHVFIDAGFKEVLRKSQQISILEVGFGTGLNTLLTLLEYRKALKVNSEGSQKLSVNFVSIEPYPIGEKMAEQLNYCQILQCEELSGDFMRLHQVNNDETISVNDRFYFTRFVTPLEAFSSDQKFDLVYFDAFSPQAQPELWTLDIFSKIHGLMNKGGIFVTYCSKGIVRRSLQQLGFQVERLKGPPGKHEMLRATVI